MAKILVAEDETIVAMEIKDRLENLGYSVIDTVSSGKEAVTRAEETHPDLVLMDIRLKGDIDGIEAAKHIRNQLNIPTVYLTAYGDDETLKRAKITEPFGYILKPFEERELRGNIEVALYKHQMENKIKENEKHLKNIVNSTSGIIISFDKNNRVSTWNKTVEIITGYKQKEVIRRSVDTLDVFDNPQELMDSIKKISHEEKLVLDKLVLRTKKGAKKIIQVSNPSIIKDDKNQNLGIVFIGKDITYEHEKHGKMLTGNSYLISGKTNRSALDLFKNLARSDYNGLLVTRSDPETIKSMVPLENIQIILLKDKSEEYETISDLKDLTAKIEKFSKEHTNSVILVDRIDYLITQFSFEQFIKSLYKINDIISENKSLFLLHLDPSILDKRQVAIIEDEIQLLPGQQIGNITIGAELHDILEFIHKSNQNNLLVSLKKIKSDMAITYPTISKRLRALESEGLIFMRKRGRLKTVHVSEKGETLLSKRQVI